MATDPSSLLRPSAKATLPPPVIPPELYPGVIKSYELGQSSNGNPLLRLPVGLLDWPDAVGPADRVQDDGAGGSIPIDLSRKQMRKDFFLTNAAYFRLENFLTAMGFDIETDAEGNKDYETPVSQLIGRKVYVEVQKILNRQQTEFMNVVGELLPNND
jgi:hypothetical protein